MSYLYILKEGKTKRKNHFFFLYCIYTFLFTRIFTEEKNYENNENLMNGIYDAHVLEEEDLIWRVVFSWPWKSGISI